MLLQPIVENSINHGLKYKDKDGILSIKAFLTENQEVEITIKDNGIGREASSKIKTKLEIKHESKGNILTSNKIDLYNKIYGKLFDIAYNDLTQKGKSSGTEVIIKIKLNKDEY